MGGALDRNPDLGVKLSLNGADRALNSSVNFTYPNFSVVQAVPVKRAGSRLVEAHSTLPPPS